MENEKNKLFVGSLTPDMDSNGLFALFNDLEGIEVVEDGAKIIMDRETGGSKCFGFVTLATDAMAEKAIELMNGKEINGKNIFVSLARPQENRNGGGSYQKRY